MEVSVPWSASG